MNPVKMSIYIVVRIVSFSACFIACISMAQADGDALFGLHWGMSPEEVRNSGATIEFNSQDRNLFVYKATSLPKNLNDVKFYKLIFDNNQSLVKMGLLLNMITDDPAGIDGKDRFIQLEKILDKKYKKDQQRSIQSSGNNSYKNIDEFYQCLAYKGCGLWVSKFEGSNMQIAIWLHGTSRGTGYIELEAESIPEWRETIERYRNSIAKDEEAAL